MNRHGPVYSVICSQLCAKWDIHNQGQFRVSNQLKHVFVLQEENHITHIKSRQTLEEHADSIKKDSQSDQESNWGPSCWHGCQAKE